ncbi:cache domain-containing protein [Bradyrhizobium sp. USDA 4486]
MLKLSVKVLAALALMVIVQGPVQAATPDEAKALADKAAALVASEGEKAFPRISDANGEFVRGDLFVAVLDQNVVVRAIMNPKLIGVSMKEATDPDDVNFAYELVNIAQSKGSGWLTYKYTNPMTRKIEPKKTWVVKVGEFSCFAGLTSRRRVGASLPQIRDRSRGSTYGRMAQ